MINSLTALFNQVLIRLGEVRISDWSSDEPRAVILREIYDQSRDEVLREYPFSCATKRVILARLYDENLSEFSYKYTLPSDFLYLQSMIDAESEAHFNLTGPFTIEGRKFFCNYSPVGIRYTKIVTDLNEFDSSVVEAIVLKLALKVSMSLIQDPDIEIKFYQQYQAAIKKAKSTDGVERINRNIKRQGWVDVV